MWTAWHPCLYVTELQIWLSMFWLLQNYSDFCRLINNEDLSFHTDILVTIKKALCWLWDHQAGFKVSTDGDQLLGNLAAGLKGSQLIRAHPKTSPCYPSLVGRAEQQGFSEVRGTLDFRGFYCCCLVCWFLFCLFVFIAGVKVIRKL